MAYCPRDMHKLGDGSLKVLRSLGFRPPDPSCGSPHVPLHGPGHPRNLPSEPVSAKKKVATQPLAGPSGPQVHIDNSRPRARPASRPYALEVFCGSGGLSIALRRWAIDTLGVDHFMPRTGARFPMVKLDLRKPEHQRILWREIRQTDVIWLAPPCGTASKARTIPINKTSRAAGAPTPRPLRGSRFPEGFPWLRGVAKDKVASANALYAFASEVWLYAQETGKISVVENPASSWMWQTKWFRPLLKSGFWHEPHACEYGSRRQKKSGLVSTIPLPGMHKVCSGRHVHLRWGPIKSKQGWSFATSL